MKQPEVFEFTEQHVKLLKNMWVQWQNCEFGAPEIDPKRPYGNSQVLLDIAEILELPIVEDVDELPTSTIERLNSLHKETLWALQIVLKYGYKLGKYQWSSYNWKFVE